VILFTAFPPAFAAVMTALHIPLTVMLVGIVLRGAAFTFRTYDDQRDEVQRRWSVLFAIASIFTPIMLGICVGAIASGRIIFENRVLTSGFVGSWLAPFPLAVGALTLVLFAFLAAVYLTVEAADPQLKEDFRRRALAAAVGVGVCALVVFLLSAEGAPRIREGISRSMWAWPLQIGTGVAAVGALWALWARRYALARALAVLQVTLILWGWGAAQFPYLVEPNITIEGAAAPDVTLWLLITALSVGALILFPSFFYLYRVFKGRQAFSLLSDSEELTR
jgi:cytochrome bd ubiquinol oxidase subunit II